MNALLTNQNQRIQSNMIYNMLGCPQCSNPLIDSLSQYEVNKDIKTVKCSNRHCDFTGHRKGLSILRKLYNK